MGRNFDFTLTLANNVCVNPLRETTKTVLFKSGPVHLWWWTFRFVALVLRILPSRTWRKRHSTGRVGDWSSGFRFSKVPYVSGPERWLFIAAFTDSSLEIQNARNVVQRNSLVLNQDQGSKIYGKFLVISRKGLLQPSTVITPTTSLPLIIPEDMWRFIRLTFCYRNCTLTVWQAAWC